MVVSGRGGNRLPAGHPARVTTPHYERHWSPHDPTERHDINQRNRCRRAAMEALLAGLISHGAHSLYLVLLDRSDKLAGPVWASHKTLGEDLGRSERTVQRYMSELAEAGFVKVQHRYRLEAGQIVYVSSLKSFHIPAAVKARLEAQEDSGAGPTPAGREAARPRPGQAPAGEWRPEPQQHPQHRRGDHQQPGSPPARRPGPLRLV